MRHLTKSFKLNTAGSDFVVGDIHGQFTLLQQRLDEIGFNPVYDRLFCPGDLVDRGPESHLTLEWLAKPWFHATSGNHDDYVIRHDSCDVGNWHQNGGSWFQDLTDEQKQAFQAAFSILPVAIDIQTPAGKVGIVHAECPFGSWEELLAELQQEKCKRRKLVKNSCMWSRNRLKMNDESLVSGVEFVVVGHSPILYPVKLGNHVYIDTCGWDPANGGKFSILNLTAMEFTKGFES